MSARYNLSEALLGLGENQMRKRGNQEGSVRFRSGSWYGRYRCYVTDLAGNLTYAEREVKIGGATSRRDALAKLRRNYIAKANAENAMPEGNATLETFVRVRFEIDHIASLSEGGKRHYKSQLLHILPTLGAMKLKDISPTIVQRLLSAKSESGLSSQTVRHIRNALSAILRYARDLEFIDGRLATEAARIPRGESARPQALTVEKAKMLLAEIPVKYRALVHFLIATGARASEAAGLRWSDVNLTSHAVIESGEARQPQTVHFRHGYRYGQYQPLKTARSRRDVPLTAGLWLELQTLYERSQHTAPADPVFTASRTSKVAPVDMHNFLMRVFKPTCEKLGMPWANLHSLRHTMSTWLDATGAPMGQRIRLLGHADAGTTMGYTHAETETARASLEKAAGRLN